MSLDLAVAYEAAGQAEQAKDAVWQALRQAPDNRKALELLQKRRRESRWTATQVWRAGLEALTHAGLPLTLAFVLHRRRRLVRYRPRLHRLVYRGLLPALALAWIAASVAESSATPWEGGIPNLWITPNHLLTPKHWEALTSVLGQPGGQVPAG